MGRTNDYRDKLSGCHLGLDAVDLCSIPSRLSHSRTARDPPMLCNDDWMTFLSSPGRSRNKNKPLKQDKFR
ncbi:hypothetical protein ACTXT7_008976 [Hymenolepis weldensis]